MPDSCSSSNFFTVKSCRCRTAHIGEWRAVAEVTGEQVAGERSKQATCRGYYSCCTVLLLFGLLLNDKSVMSGFWVLGWAYFQLWRAYFQLWRAYFRMGWAYFRERGFSKICPPPSFSSQLTSSPMGVFLRDYGTERLPLANHLCLSSCNHLTFMRDRITECQNIEY